MDKFSELTTEKLEAAKKKAVTHCLNLECKKEQMHILIKKLGKISGQRLDMFGAQPTKPVFGSKKSSISEELKFAQQNTDVIDMEIRNAKYQLKMIDNLLKKRENV